MTAGQPKTAEVGPVCRKLLGLSDSSWQELTELVTPSEADHAFVRKVVGALRLSSSKWSMSEMNRLTEQQPFFELEGVTVDLVGASAAGTSLPGQGPSVALQYKSQACSVDADRHKLLLDSLKVLLKKDTLPGPYRQPDYTIAQTVPGEGLICMLGLEKFRSGAADNLPEALVQRRFGVMLVSQPPTLPVLMDGTLTRDERKLANVATFPALTEFLKQQPPLYKLAARVVKLWAQQGGER
jgi:hypothetical protein